VDLVAITVPPGGQAEAGAALPAGFCPGDSPLFVEGGASRQASVHAALRSLAPFRLSHVLIHDGARPFVSSSLIRRVIAAALRHGAAVPIVPLTDTVKEIDGDGFIKRHLRRAALGNAQTPQGFRFGEILQAHDKAEALGLECTDDAEVWGEFAGRVAWVPGEEANRKITFPEDLR
jgi:2-C-methyl-D-erythritol 4-phosphate cytidylyltransferase/2-C-methyl-D-erythritol 4-phosphate cytidylyltransferase/2-C-methyl-D-erythritol 2,4-cyclodiphosphate synthase